MVSFDLPGVPSSPRVQWFLEQAEFWASQQQLPKARQLITQAIKQDSGCKARLTFGAFLYHLNEVDEAIREFSQALNLARQQQQHLARAAACRLLARIHREQGDTAMAASFQQQEIAANLAAPMIDSEEPNAPANWIELANAALAREEWDQAQEWIVQAFRSASARENLGELADVFGTCGVRAFLKHETRTAWEWFLKAYVLHCQVRDEEGRLADLLNLAQASRELGWWELVKRFLEKGKKIATLTVSRKPLQQIEHDLEEANRILAVSQRTPEWN